MTKDVPHLRVLVVDDELLIRWSIAETLTSVGHAIVEADSAATAMRVLNDPAVAIDAVVLDYRLPDSNDLTLLATMRRLAPDRPIILMTAYGSPEVTQGARSLGVYEILNKPFEMHDLAVLLLAACDSDGR